MPRKLTLKQVIAFIFASYIYSVAAAQTPSQLVHIDTIDFTSDSSYALFNLDLNGIAPSITVIKLATRKGEIVIPSRSQQKQNKSLKKYLSIPLKGLENGMHLLKLPAGVYQITDIKSPSYNLAYRLTTDYSPAWRFEVFENSVSYAGTIYISPERSINNVDFQLKNHFATDLDEMNKALQAMPANYQLRIGKHPKDDFYKHYLQSKGL